MARFSLDRQVTDLNDSIHQKESVIGSYGDLEANVRLAQYKIDQYQQIEQSTNITDIFPALSVITPRGVTLNELVIKPSSVVLDGVAFDQSSLNILINNIQLSNQFFNVAIDSIEAGDERVAGFKFRLKANTQEEIKLSPTSSQKK